jgi:acetyltransferase-like isoleucine patch superfamily enzyme
MQFKKNNLPTLLDKLWNFTRIISYSNYKKYAAFFELGSSLYRYFDKVKLGDNVYLKRWSSVGCANDEACIQIGDNTTIGFGSIIVSSGLITIGDNCMISAYVHIVDSNHGYSLKTLFNEQENIISTVHIGSNVWIGTGVVVLAGVSIGDNVVIAAGSVVTKSFESGTMIAGVPAKIIKILS